MPLSLYTCKIQMPRRRAAALPRMCLSQYRVDSFSAHASFIFQGIL